MKPVTHKHLIEHELEGFGIRCNKMPPKIKFSRKDKGGINLSTSVNQSEVTLEVCKQICAEYRCHCADIRITEDVTIDQLIDVRQHFDMISGTVFARISRLCAAPLPTHAVVTRLSPRVHAHLVTIGSRLMLAIPWAMGCPCRHPVPIRRPSRATVSTSP